MPNCTYCGADLPGNARFCSHCGKVPATVAEQTPQMRAAPMQSILPPLPQSTSVSQSGEQQRNTPPPTIGVSRDGQSSTNNTPPVTVRPTKPSSRWPGNIPSRWLIIGLVALIVVASGLGILTALVRSHLTSSATSSSQNTPATGLCTNQPLCTPPSGLKTPVIGGSAVINLTLSGAVNGRLRVTKVSRCGISGTQYDLLMQGKVGGTEYDLVFRITAYKGAGTYTAGQLFTNLTQQPVSVNTTWVNAGNAQATATIHSNVKTGTMNVTVSGAVNSVHITGSWRCA